MYMENNLEINIDEVLRYLGYKGQIIEEKLINDIKLCIVEAKQLIRPKYTYKICELDKKEEVIKINNSNLIFESKDIDTLLKNSSKCVLIAATIGDDIERKIKLYSKINITKATILDACATTAIEGLCDYVELILRNTVLDKNQNLTFRYSPGYGDLTLDIQKDFISVLECNKSIGLNVSSAMILQPRKSVTAIVGITNEKVESKSKCINCSNNNTCSFKREDDESGCFRKNKR